MRISATCERCGRELLLFQLYNASPLTADRCPHCSAHLGIVGVAPLAASTDRALDALVDCLRELAGRKRGFRIEPESVLAPITEAVEAAARPDGQTKTPSGQAA